MDADPHDALITAARGGDAAAFDRLVAAFGRDLRIFVAAHAVDRDQLEEVCQATWVTAWEKLPLWRPEAPFDRWLRGIARNLLRRELEARARGRRRRGIDVLEQAVASEAVERIDEDERRIARLPECLAGLPPRARDLVLARDRDGARLADLARRFKRPMGALATTLWRIRQSLRACLDRERA